MRLGELFMTLGFDVDDKKLKEFNSAVNSLAMDMGKTVAVVTGAIWAIDRFVAGLIKSAAALADFNNQTGLSTQKLQEWQSAAQMSNLGISAQDVLSSIKAIQDNLVQIKLGGGNVSPFQMMGIDIAGKDAFGVLEQVRERIKGMDRNVAVNLMQQMGINPQMLNVLQLSRSEFEKLGAEFRRTHEMTQSALNLGVAINRLGMQFDFWKDQLTAEVAPALIKGIDLFYEFVVAIKDIYAAMQKSDALKMFVYSLAAAFGVLVLSLSPITAAAVGLTAIFSGLLYILKDVADYINGKDSFTGKLVDDAKEFYGWILKAINLLPFRAALNADRISPEQMSAAMNRAQTGNKTMTINNNIKIDATGISSYDAFVGRLQNDMNNIITGNMKTLSDFNNAGR